MVIEHLAPEALATMLVRVWRSQRQEKTNLNSDTASGGAGFRYTRVSQIVKAAEHDGIKVVRRVWSIPT